MPKRALAAFLWFASMWFAYEVIWSLTGVPRVLGPIMGAAAAIVVTLDPTGWFWSRTKPGRALPATPLARATTASTK
jgi:hypothetical protein